jgi:ribulose-5-phosphate 4-epimerase/fuculose-1-phosphate aldolase
MEQNIRKIAFNIYASSEDEAERGRKAIVSFINIMGQHGAMVSGEKIAEAVGRMNNNSFITSQIIKFFKT